MYTYSNIQRAEHCIHALDRSFGCILDAVHQYGRVLRRHFDSSHHSSTSDPRSPTASTVALILISQSHLHHIVVRTSCVLLRHYISTSRLVDLAVSVEVPSDVLPCCFTYLRFLPRPKVDDGSTGWQWAREKKRRKHVRGCRSHSRHVVGLACPHLFMS